MIRGLEVDRAEEYVQAALDAVEREYPYAPAVVLHGPDDLRPPAELHPAFHGAFDWHSSVHMLRSLVRLLRRFPELDCADRVRATLHERLTAGNLAAEAAYLEANPVFERPYGWAWALALEAELTRWDDPAAPGLAAAVKPLGDAITELWRDYLPRLTYPNRNGYHGNSAFALLLATDAGRVTGRTTLVDRCTATAERWFLRDRDAPVAYEPAGEDFLSPTLTEAHLMGALLDPGDFETWFERFVRGTADVLPASLRDPPVVSDASDPRIVHLHGLTLSRAWSWRAIAGALPPRDERRVAALDAADRHLAAGLDHVVTGDFVGDHWLVSFALLALDGL